MTIHLIGPRRSAQRQGVAAMIAMMYLVLLSTLAIAMFEVSTLNTRSAANLGDNDRARAAAESGLRWMSWRFARMARPKTSIGQITPAVANGMWAQSTNSIIASIRADLSAMQRSTERGLTAISATEYQSAPIRVDDTGATFQLTFQQWPEPWALLGPGETPCVLVTSTGSYGNSAQRSISVAFDVGKKVRFAIVGKVPIQLGRSTIVEGPVAMATANRYPPVLMLSDFRHLNTSLRDRIDGFNTFLEGIHPGYDNRINVNNPDEIALATQAGYRDVNSDGYVDEYDLFIDQYDANDDGKITQSEFTNPSTNKLYDADLFNAIDALGAPMYAGDPARLGYQDGVIDNYDAYTKVRGQISMATTASAWEANLGAGKSISDMIVGPIQAADGATVPVKFGADASEIFDLSPANFDTSTFKNRTGTAAGTPLRTSGRIENTSLTASDVTYSPPTRQVTNKGGTSLVVGQIYLKTTFDAANAATTAAGKAVATGVSPSTTVPEHTPYGSTSWQATYQRPVFRHIAFKNVRVPKGLNALFDNCTFKGVTFVELTTNITKNGATTTNASDGMSWSQRMKSGQGSFNKDTALTTTNSLGFDSGNNLRFNNCTMNGPIASDNPTAYTHFTNSWEFTGSTTFDNQVDQTATIVAPQTNIEMGSFTDPSQAPSTLVGVVVAGNIDIRGTSVVDGSIIVTGDGAGNTTQGWFGPSDNDTTSDTQMPEGGYGRLNIRYNPYRPLPDGINVMIDILPDISTYQEGLQ
jgi:Tfp pilus assembly protein PilX